MENEDIAFADLYGVIHVVTKEEKSGLMEWYDKVYYLPISRFTVEDLARSCRQELFPDYIVPRVLKILRKCPMAGELYDGELFDALLHVPTTFWQQSVLSRKHLIGNFDQWQDRLRAELEPFDFDKLRAFVQTVRDM